jgi:hypothetical protein
MVDNDFTGGERGLVAVFIQYACGFFCITCDSSHFICDSPNFYDSPFPPTNLFRKPKPIKKTYPSLKGKIGCSRNSFINLLHGNFYISCRFHRSMVRYVRYLVVLLLAFSLVSCRRLLLSGLLLGLLPLLPFPDYCGFLLS